MKKRTSLIIIGIAILTILIASSLSTAEVQTFTYDKEAQTTEEGKVEQAKIQSQAIIIPEGAKADTKGQAVDAIIADYGAYDLYANYNDLKNIEINGQVYDYIPAGTKILVRTTSGKTTVTIKYPQEDIDATNIQPGQTIPTTAKALSSVPEGTIAVLPNGVEVIGPATIPTGMGYSQIILAAGEAGKTLALVRYDDYIIQQSGTGKSTVFLGNSMPPSINANSYGYLAIKDQTVIGMQTKGFLKAKLPMQYNKDQGQNIYLATRMEHYPKVASSEFTFDSTATNKYNFNSQDEGLSGIVKIYNTYEEPQYFSGGRITNWEMKSEATEIKYTLEDGELHYGYSEDSLPLKNWNPAAITLSFRENSLTIERNTAYDDMEDQKFRDARNKQIKPLTIEDIKIKMQGIRGITGNTPDQVLRQLWTAYDQRIEISNNARESVSVAYEQRRNPSQSHRKAFWDQEIKRREDYQKKVDGVKREVREALYGFIKGEGADAEKARQEEERLAKAANQQ